jgi:hypothetical protein
MTIQINYPLMRKAKCHFNSQLRHDFFVIHLFSRLIKIASIIHHSTVTF